MSGASDGAKALRLLQGLEAGGLSVADAQILAQDMDPVLVHVVIRFLREVYPVSNPAASAVLERVRALSAASPWLVARAKEGERDPISVWFASEYSFRDFRGRGRELIDTIVDKLES